MPTITTALSKNFKIELLKGNHDLTAADIQLALGTLQQQVTQSSLTTSLLVLAVAQSVTLKLASLELRRVLLLLLWTL